MASCPTPWKVPYQSRNEAKPSLYLRAASVGRSKGQLRPYSCVCGYWHLSHMSRNDVRLAKRKRRAA